MVAEVNFDTRLVRWGNIFMKKSGFECPECGSAIKAWADVDAQMSFVTSKSGKLTKQIVVLFNTLCVPLYAQVSGIRIPMGSHYVYHPRVIPNTANPLPYAICMEREKSGREVRDLVFKCHGRFIFWFFTSRLL